MVSSLVLCRAALRRAVTPPPFLPPQMQAPLPEQQQVHCWSLILLEVPSGRPLPAAAAIVFKIDSYTVHAEQSADCLIWSVLLTQRHMTAANADLCFALCVACSIALQAYHFYSACCCSSFL